MTGTATPQGLFQWYCSPFVKAGLTAQDPWVITVVVVKGTTLLLYKLVFRLVLVLTCPCPLIGLTQPCVWTGLTQPAAPVVVQTQPCACFKLAATSQAVLAVVIPVPQAVPAAVLQAWLAVLAALQAVVVVVEQAVLAVFRPALFAVLRTVLGVFRVLPVQRLALRFVFVFIVFSLLVWIWNVFQAFYMSKRYGNQRLLFKHPNKKIPTQQRSASHSNLQQGQNFPKSALIISKVKVKSQITFRPAICNDNFVQDHGLSSKNEVYYFLCKKVELAFFLKISSHEIRKYSFFTQYRNPKNNSLSPTKSPIQTDATQKSYQLEKVIIRQIQLFYEIFTFINKQKAYMGFITSKAESAPIPAFTYQNMIKYITNYSIFDDYELKQILGKGSFAQVRKAKSKKSGVMRAVKVIDRVKHAKIQPLLLNQFAILKQMDHPNILKIYQIYQEPKYYYIVTEFCSGRELFDILREKKLLSEGEAGPIFYQLCLAVQYLHSKGVMHRDLKPQNVMYDENTKSLKLIDFGSALRYESDQVMQKRRVGTSFYIAPEVIDRCYNSKCDIWSLGVVLYVLLSGQAPFKGKNDDQVLLTIMRGEYDFMKNTWDSVSSQAKMLITELLTQNPYSRPSIIQVLKSDWIKKYVGRLQLEEPTKLGLSKALSNMQKFNDTKSNNIEGAVLVFIVNFVKNPGDEVQLQKCFQELDLNGDGILSLEQLTIGLQKYLKVGKKEAKAVATRIFKRVDTNNSGFIDYSQFIVAANSMEISATPQNLQLAFDCIDQDNNGFLSTEELRSRLGDNIPLQAYEKMLKENIPNWKGQISKKNFVEMMTKILNKN